MAAKAAQEKAKQKAAQIAEEAKASRKSAAKTKTKKETEVKEEVEETANVKEASEKEIKEDPKAPADDIVSQAQNTATEEENRVEVSTQAAKEFQESSDEEDMFLRRSIHLPGRRAIRKAFEQEEIVGDEFGEIITEGKQRELEYQLLSDSAKAKKPKRLLGRVKGIEPVYGSDNKIITYEAKVSLIMNPDDPEVKAQIREMREPTSMYSIYIPAPMFFFMRNPKQFEGADGMRNLLRAMRNKINSIIEFVVYDISPDDNRVIGSRIRAMQLKAHEYFLDPRTKKITPGTKAYARITEAGQAGITVEVCGAECYIRNSELSWLHLNNASEMYKVGQSIPVVVETIEVGRLEVNGRNTQFVAITASAKKAKPNPIEKYGAQYNVGSLYHGVVTYRLPEGLYIVRLDDRVECICYPPQFGTPYVGARCSIFIRDKNAKGLTGNFAYLA